MLVFYFLSLVLSGLVGFHLFVRYKRTGRYAAKIPGRTPYPFIGNMLDFDISSPGNNKYADAWTNVADVFMSIVSKIILVLRIIRFNMLKSESYQWIGWHYIDLHTKICWDNFWYFIILSHHYWIIYPVHADYKWSKGNIHANNYFFRQFTYWVSNKSKNKVLYYTLQCLYCYDPKTYDKFLELNDGGIDFIKIYLKNYASS